MTRQDNRKTFCKFRLDLRELSGENITAHSNVVEHDKIHSTDYLRGNGDFIGKKHLHLPAGGLKPLSFRRRLSSAAIFVIPDGVNPFKTLRITLKIGKAAVGDDIQQIAGMQNMKIFCLRIGKGGGEHDHVLGMSETFQPLTVMRKIPGVGFHQIADIEMNQMRI